MSRFDEYSATYTAKVSEATRLLGLSADFFSRAKAAYIEQHIARTFPDRARLEVLDVGCGVAAMHSILPAARLRLTGVDVSARSLDVARAANPHVQYLHYDGQRLPFPDQVFDVALAICVMHHVTPSSWLDFLREIHRIMAPGGSVMIFEHNPLNPLTRLVVSRCEFDRDAVLLRSGVLRALVARVGFAGIERRFILSIPFGGRVATAIDRALGQAPTGAQYYVTGRKSPPLRGGA